MKVSITQALTDKVSFLALLNRVFYSESVGIDEGAGWLGAKSKIIPLGTGETVQRVRRLPYMWKPSIQIPEPRFDP